MATTASPSVAPAANTAPVTDQAAAPAAAQAPEQQPVTVTPVAPKPDAQGKVRFELPIDPKDIASVEAVDVDLIVVTRKGERFLLPEAAIDAATAANPKIVFSSGDPTDAANLFKQVGSFKPVVGGSFRLQATEIKPTPPDPQTGQAIGLGAAEETQVQVLRDQIADLQDKVSQAQAAAEAAKSQAEPVPQFKSNSVATATNIDTASSSASSTKTKDQEKTQEQTKDNITELVFPNITPPGQKGAAEAKVAGVHIWDGTSPTNTAFNATDVRFMLGDNRLKVRVDANAGEVTTPAGNDPTKAYTSLFFTGQSKLATIRISHDPNLVETLPEGFLLNGKNPFTETITIAANDINNLLVPMEWKLTADGVPVVPTSFTLKIEYLDANGVLISRNPLATKFTFGEANSVDYYALDGNANPIVKLLARGLSYDITGRDGVNDTIKAQYGSDVVSGLGGNDTIDGGSGDDILFGGTYGSQGLALYNEATDATTGTGNDVLLGGTGNDKLYGQDGKDNLQGGDGDDLLVGGAGSDQLVGGAGNDTASYRGSDDGVTVRLALLDQGGNAGGHAQGDELYEIENLIGSKYDDTLVGSSVVNKLEGGDGNDVLEGRESGDTLDGGGGSNTASYASDASGSLVVSLLNPNLNTGDAAGDVYINIQNLIGSSGNDNLTGDAQANRIQGGLGLDTLLGLDGDDTLVGGEGDDLLIGGLGKDTLDGGDNSDTASYQNATSFVRAYLVAATQAGSAAGEADGDTFTNVENLTGSAFNDTLGGDGAANILNGGAGNDILIGGGGGDALLGGEGIDTASYENSASGLTVSLIRPGDNTGDAQNDSFTSIENLTGSNYSDFLYGNASANTINGGGGNDVLYGMGGGDTFVGGEGADTVSYSSAASSVTVYMSASQQVLNAGAAVGDTYTGVENITGSSQDDFITGDSQGNVLLGGDGDDTLDGGLGSTVTDTLNGGNGEDTITYANAAIGVTLSLVSGGSIGDATGDTYLSIENVIGSKYKDSIEGDSGNNVIRALDGDDDIKGGGGSDVLYGGDGDDTFSNIASKGSVQTFYGGDGLTDTGNDTVTYDGSEKFIRVSLQSGGFVFDSDGTTKLAEQVFIGVENLIGGNKADDLTGNGSDNLLVGGLGNDTLSGGAGNDNLQGGAGDDVLEGGAGADTLNGGADTGVGNRDVASYANSTVTTTGLTIDLSVSVAGEGNGLGTGDAAGDGFTGIETVVGTRLSDTFYASLDANRFDGGDVTTAESDTVNYSKDPNGINLNLGTGTIVWTVDQVNSLIRGDSFVGIENIVGALNQANTIRGSAANNVLTGGTKNDKLYGGDGLEDGDDTLDGGEGDNELYGGGGNDTLKAGTGTNLFVGGLGNDTLTGGAGINDTADYSYVTGNVNIDLSITVQTNMALGDRDTISGIEHLIGSANADTLKGNATVNNLSGGKGNDTLFGRGDADTLFGGEGDDVLVGGAGADNLVGGDKLDGSDAADAGNNTASYEDAAAFVVARLDGLTTGVTGDAVGDKYVNIQNLTGSDFNDTLRGNGSANVLNGGKGGDTLYGGDGADTLNGYGGNPLNAADDVADTLYGEGGADTLNGGAGGDTLYGGDGADTLNGDDGNDTLFGEADNDILNGGQGNDTLNGGSGTNELNGGDGADTLVASDGKDKYVGGIGIDTVTYDASKAATLTIDTFDGGSGDGIAAGDTFDTVEIVIGSAGNDTFLANDTAMEFRGGLGTNTVSYRLATGGVGVSASLLNADNSNGWALGDTFVNIQNLTGSNFADVLSGDLNRNVIDGGAGDDTFYGMINTSGSPTQGDSYIGGDNNDTLSYANIGSKYKVQVTINEDGSGKAEILEGTNLLQTDTFTGVENIAGTGGGSGAADDEAPGLTDVGSELNGNSGANVLVATTAKDILFGKAGNDTLRGLGGDDELYGGDGNDLLYGGSGNDIIYGDVGSAKDTVTVSTSNDILYGGSGDDQLFGGDGNDILYGYGDAKYRSDYLTKYPSAESGDGGDVLNGGAGNNHFYGGAGADVFTAVPTGGATAFYTSAYNSYDPAASISATLTNLATFVGNFARYEDQAGSGTVDFSAAGKATGQAVGDLYDGSITGAIGFAGATTFWGRGSGEIFIGNNGNDVFMGSAGDDIFDGRIGTDTADYSLDVLVDHTVNLQNNSLNSGGMAQGDKLFSIEVLIGSTGKDTFTGNLTVGTTLDGGDGDDTLTGGNVVDTLLGGAGNDVLTGGKGNDVLSGGDGNDKLNGGDDADTLTAGIGVDELNGDAGNDTLDFRAGNTEANLNGDIANGGADNDTIKIDQSKLAATLSTFKADGGLGTDTLELWATGNASTLTNFNLSSIVNGDFTDDFNNFEVLDLSKDGVKTNIIFTSADIQKLVDAGNSSSLTIRLKAGQDELTLPVEPAIQTGANSYDYYTNTTYTTKVASVTVEYV